MERTASGKQQSHLMPIVNCNNIMPRGEMIKTDTKKKIIRLCAPLLHEKGYLSVPISELEKASQQSKTIIYQHFDNKTSLAVAALDYNLELKRIKINQNIKPYYSCKKKLLKHIETYYPTIESPFIGDGCPIFKAAGTIGNSNEEMRLRVAKALLLWKQDLSDTIKKGKLKSEFKHNVQEEDVAWEIISLIESAVVISRTTQNLKLGLKMLDQAKIKIMNLASIK